MVDDEMTTDGGATAARTVVQTVSADGGAHGPTDGGASTARPMADGGSRRQRRRRRELMAGADGGADGR